MPMSLASCVWVRAEGVVIVGQGTPIVEAIEGLVLMWVASDAEEWRAASHGCRSSRDLLPGGRRSS